jgi:hypothetical protein
MSEVKKYTVYKVYDYAEIFSVEAENDEKAIDLVNNNYGDEPDLVVKDFNSYIVEEEQ